MAKIGEVIDPNELEEESPAGQPVPGPEPSFADKARMAWEHIKGAGKQLGNEGVDQLEAALTGASGPFTAVPAGILALEMKAANGGDLSDRFKQAQQVYASNLNHHPVAGMLGAVASPVNKLMPASASVLGRAGSGAIQGAATNYGLGGGALGGAAIGGGLSLAGSGIGALIKGAANSEMLSPLINRLKFLKPSPEEAQPLSEAGQDIRGAISDAGEQGLWGGLPSREAMLERFKGAQAPAGQKIGDILSHADEVNASLPNRVSPPENAFANSQAKLQDLLNHSRAMRINPENLQATAEQEGNNIANAWGARGSLADLNGAKADLYKNIYEPNITAPATENPEPGNSLLRMMGRDVKNSIQGSLDDLHNIDPSVDAEGFAGANKQYGTLADLIGPLNRGIGKEIAGGENANIRGSTFGHLTGNIMEMLNFGGGRQLAQAHAGEALQNADRVLTIYQPAQSVARAFVAGTTPGINQEEEENRLP